MIYIGYKKACGEETIKQLSHKKNCSRPNYLHRVCTELLTI